MKHTKVHPLRTGGFVQTVFAAIRLDVQHRHDFSGRVMLDALEDPAFAGYCLDAPDVVPAGSMKTVSGTIQPSTFSR